MKKNIIFLLAFTFFFNFSIKADEGMWLLSLIGKNYQDMQKAGFKLTAEDIYSINKSCIKDAIVGLGREGTPFWHFCTGEIVSEQGLFFTNHHCGFGMIQSHSTLEHDYLKDGFWAYSQKEELPNENITASILIRMEDVSEQILAKLDSKMSEQERAAKIAEISTEICKKATQDNYYQAKVIDMFKNNQFFLFVHAIYKDVRLVGAPPSSMGKFGGDTDNWMWPRHTCDFSMFRIYTAPDGTPATYAENNIPLKPKHFLPISIKGVEDGDFAMILGFPGTTDRFLTSYGLEETLNITNKLRYEIRTVKINLLREDMAADPQVRIQYASKYASCSNYWKYSNEQNKALKQLNTMAIKKDFEAKYQEWANKQSDKHYMTALAEIDKAYKSRAKYAEARMYLREGLISGADLPSFVRQFNTLNDVLNSDKQDKLSEMIAKYKTSINNFYKDYNFETEKKVMKALFEYSYSKLDKNFYPDFFITVEKKYKANFDKYINDVFKKSIFANKESLLAFLDKPNAKKLSNDPMFIISNSSFSKYLEVNKLYNTNAEELDKALRYYVDGVLQIQKDKNLAPDANSTIRCTFGNVKAYEPRDGVFYSHYTTLKGVLEKENPNSSEFQVPQKLKDLINNKDFGQYANKNGELVACFITNNDITGGNSGSPVINAEGHLIGHAFDGNSEAMSGDIDFEEILQRCINLDVRYTLFVIDKYANAQNIIKELKIVK